MVVFPVMAVCSGGHRRQRKGPRAPEEIEGGETQLQRGREDRWVELTMRGGSAVVLCGIR
jgi:hypothetical protein